MRDRFKGTVKSFREFGKDGFEASVRSFGELGKGFQAIRASMMDYTKKSFEDGTRAFEQLAGAKSIEQAWEHPRSDSGPLLSPKAASKTT